MFLGYFCLFWWLWVLRCVIEETRVYFGQFWVVLGSFEYFWGNLTFFGAFGCFRGVWLELFCFWVG